LSKYKEKIKIDFNDNDLTLEVKKQNYNDFKKKPSINESTIQTAIDGNQIDEKLKNLLFKKYDLFAKKSTMRTRFLIFKLIHLKYT